MNERFRAGDHRDLMRQQVWQDCPESVIFGMGAAWIGNSGHSKNISVFPALKDVFLYSPGKGIQKQAIMPVEYARVYTMDQNPELQTDAPQQAAGCERIFTKKSIRIAS